MIQGKETKISANDFRQNTAYYFKGLSDGIFPYENKIGILRVNQDGQFYIEFTVISNELLKIFFEDKSHTITPIPLSPEILEKVGFIECLSPYSDVQAFVIGKDADRIVWCNNELYKPLSEYQHFVRITNANYPIDDYPCQYLHQLQNLYYSLTGNSLYLIYKLIK